MVDLIWLILMGLNILKINHINPPTCISMDDPTCILLRHNGPSECHGLVQWNLGILDIHRYTTYTIIYVRSKAIYTFSGFPMPGNCFRGGYLSIFRWIFSSFWHPSAAPRNAFLFGRGSVGSGAFFGLVNWRPCTRSRVNWMLHFSRKRWGKYSWNMLKVNETSQKPLILGIGFGFGLIGKKMDQPFWCLFQAVMSVGNLSNIWDSSFVTPRTQQLASCESNAFMPVCTARRKQVPSCAYTTCKLYIVHTCTYCTWSWVWDSLFCFMYTPILDLTKYKLGLSSKK